MNLPSLGFDCSCGPRCGCSGPGLGYIPTYTPWIYNGVRYPHAPIRWSTSLVPYIDERENNYGFSSDYGDYGFPPAIAAAIIAGAATVAATGVSVGAASSSASKSRKAGEAAACPSVALIDKQIATLKPNRGGLFNSGLFAFNGVGKEIKALKKERKVAAADCQANPAPMAAMPPPVPESASTVPWLPIGLAVLGVLTVGGIALARRSA